MSASPSGAATNVEGPQHYLTTSTTITFTDHGRSTPASNGDPSLHYRSLRTLVVLPNQPAAPRRGFPLIIYSHGFGATAASALPTLESLASHGFVVAAPDFPLSTPGLPGSPDLFDFNNQPADVSFVITQMLKQNGLHTSPLYRRIETHRIGVVGHSLGAVTTLAVSYNSCCRDVRIGAAAEMDGELNVPIGAAGKFPGIYFKGHNPPLLVVNGTKDTVGPYAVSKTIYATAPAPKYFFSLIGAPHEGFAMAPWSPIVNNTLAAFFDRYLGRGDSVAAIKRAGNKPGIATMQVSAR
jgi:dienelactone hydrolase